MRELSLHILDIAENGITAGADCIHILGDRAEEFIHEDDWDLFAQAFESHID